MQAGPPMLPRHSASAPLLLRALGNRVAPAVVITARARPCSPVGRAPGSLPATWTVPSGKRVHGSTVRAVPGAPRGSTSPRGAGAFRGSANKGDFWGAGERGPVKGEGMRGPIGLRRARTGWIWKTLTAEMRRRCVDAPSSVPVDDSGPR